MQLRYKTGKSTSTHSVISEALSTNVYFLSAHNNNSYQNQNIQWSYVLLEHNH